MHAIIPWSMPIPVSDWLTYVKDWHISCFRCHQCSVPRRHGWSHNSDQDRGLPVVTIWCMTESGNCISLSGIPFLYFQWMTNNKAFYWFSWIGYTMLRVLSNRFQLHVKCAILMSCPDWQIRDLSGCEMASSLTSLKRPATGRVSNSATAWFQWALQCHRPGMVSAILTHWHL